jgi:hypothetical protein
LTFPAALRHVSAALAILGLEWRALHEQTIDIDRIGRLGRVIHGREAGDDYSDRHPS